MSELIERLYECMRFLREHKHLHDAVDDAAKELRKQEWHYISDGLPDDDSVTYDVACYDHEHDKLVVFDDIKMHNDGYLYLPQTLHLGMFEAYAYRVHQPDNPPPLEGENDG